MEIIWNGHACFTVETEDGRVVFAPYEDGKVPGLAPLRLYADLVLCSHEHADHNYRSGVALSGREHKVEVEQIPSWHDEVRGRTRGNNIIHVIRAEGMKLVHLGDLGCELSREQIREIAEADILMVPIGGYYTIDTEQALNLVAAVRPRITIPMHFRGEAFGFDVLSTSDAFREKCFNPVNYSGNRITVDRSTPSQTVFFTCPA